MIPTTFEAPRRKKDPAAMAELATMYGFTVRCLEETSFEYIFVEFEFRCSFTIPVLVAQNAPDGRGDGVCAVLQPEDESHQHGPELKVAQNLLDIA